MSNLPQNKIFHQDILQTLQALPDDSLDMVYGDPDYNVGINYAGKNYTQKWNDYIDWYIALTKECMQTDRQFIYDQLPQTKCLLESKIFR
jgi:DNA modification methylase